MSEPPQGQPYGQDPPGSGEPGQGQPYGQGPPVAGPPPAQPYGAGAPSYGQGQPPYGQGQPPYGPPPGYGQPPYGYGPPGAPTRMTPGEERGWAVGAHLSAIVAQFLGPLLVFLIQGPKSPFVREHAAEALNFNLSVTIYFVVAIVLAVVLIGFLLLPAVLVMWFVCTIIATVKAGNGEGYRYPLTIRFVK